MTLTYRDLYCILQLSRQHCGQFQGLVRIFDNGDLCATNGASIVFVQTPFYERLTPGVYRIQADPRRYSLVQYRDQPVRACDLARCDDVDQFPTEKRCLACIEPKALTFTGFNPHLLTPLYDLGNEGPVSISDSCPMQVTLHGRPGISGYLMPMRG